MSTDALTGKVQLTLTSEAILDLLESMSVESLQILMDRAIVILAARQDQLSTPTAVGRGGLNDEEFALLAAGDFLGAVAAYRHRTPKCGLKEAMDVVKPVIEAHGFNFKKGK